MKITVDFAKGTVETVSAEGVRAVPVYSAEAFDAVSSAWLKIGWVVKYIYGFTWMVAPSSNCPTT